MSDWTPERIKQLRADIGTALHLGKPITKLALAHAICVNQSTVHRWETGEAVPPTALLDRLARLDLPALLWLWAGMGESIDKPPATLENMLTTAADKLRLQPSDHRRLKATLRTA